MKQAYYYLYYTAYKLIQKTNPNNPVPDIGGVYFVTLLFLFNLVTCLSIMRLWLKISYSPLPIYSLLAVLCAGFNYYFLIRLGKSKEIIETIEKRRVSKTRFFLQLSFVIFYVLLTIICMVYVLTLVRNSRS